VITQIKNKYIPKETYQYTNKGETMDITYQREVSHCAKSPYIKMYTVQTVEPAQNSDALDIIKFVETDYQSIVKRGSITNGEEVMFIPPESVLPFELSEELNITKYLSKGRVIITKLRGNRSEGIVVPPAIVEPYIPYIMQWEDQPTVQMMGMMTPKIEIPKNFEVFYKMPNIRNEPDTFVFGEQVAISEKIHGTNCRFGIFKNPSDGKEQLYVGSHKTVLKESDENIYWKCVKDTLPDDIQLPMNTTFYCEIYGKGVQDMHYETNAPALKIFAIYREKNYVEPSQVEKTCNELSLPCVEYKYCKYMGLEKMKNLANAQSTLYDGFKEGIVVVSTHEPNKMGKIISDRYLERKNKTERH
jgi:RNA ligase (TIGR02306 family)